ncbi:MAG TPA: DUF2088 domain-containing protein [Candidatus Latescibacteria bacterium]|nr:DUF2088 domain-containing protein [Candidatus Latescibacterota bacterium]
MTGKGYVDRLLGEGEVRSIVEDAFSKWDLEGKRVLFIVPDGTRTAPIPMMFRLFHELLSGKVRALDYLIALGTHPPMSQEAINRLAGVSPEDWEGRYRDVRVFNHRWDLPDIFASLGTIPASEIAEITEGLIEMPVEVRLNQMVLDYDSIVICGPVFPHEVVGFSGGNKYFFPGIGGWEVINFSHWLGAVITILKIIGVKHTPVRRVIDRAAGLLDKPKYCLAMVVKDEGLAGLYTGTPEEAYELAVDLSAKVHVVWVERPFRKVISVMPEMYDDIWTAAKGMYKVEPAVADGGEVIIYAPHITEISYTHGNVLDEIGYHVRDYFLKQWDKFKHYPWGVLAHSTHLKGFGWYDERTGVEKPRVEVYLATGIPKERVERVNLKYIDPSSFRPEDYMGREDDGILVLPKAGEVLYRLKKEGG